MNIDFVGVHRLDEPTHHPKIIPADPPRREISRVRERGMRRIAAHGDSVLRMRKRILRHLP